MIISAAQVSYATRAEQYNAVLDALVPIGGIVSFSKGLWSMANNVTYFKNGTCNSDVLNHLVQTTADFSTVAVGDLAQKVTSGDFATITVKNSNTNLTLDWDLFPLGNEAYRLWRQVALTVFNTDDAVRWQECNGALITDPDSPFYKGGSPLNAPTITPNTAPYRTFFIRIK
jgi:hypothetical protein